MQEATAEGRRKFKVKRHADGRFSPEGGRQVEVIPEYGDD